MNKIYRVCIYSVLLLLINICCFNGGEVFAIDANDFSITLNYLNKSYVYNFDNNIPKCNTFLEYRQLQKNDRLKDNVARFNKINEILDLGFTYDNAFEYMFFNWGKFYNKVKEDINCEPIDATITFNPNSNKMFNLTHEKLGYLIDDALIYNDILQQMESSSNIVVNIKPQVLRPKVMYNELINWTSCLSKFSTSYASSTDDRKHNVKTALSKFNAMVVMPNETISFNKVTGKRTKESGYKEAKIIKDKEYVEAYGGGVCQSSTTLYNALILAGVQIVEVRSHSLAPSYIDYAFDAMVNYGSSDLKFRNQYDTPIFIHTYCDDKNVNVEIYGKQINDYTIKRVSEIVQTITPPNDKIIIDKKGEYLDKVKYVDESIYITYPKNGYLVKGYLEYYKGDKLINKKLIRTTKYQSVQGVKVYGAMQKVLEEDNNDSFFDTLNKLLAKKE